MNSEHSEKVASKLEALCRQGCNHVNQVLEQAKNGNVIEELAGFEQDEIEQIIHELVHIMSVYDKRSSLIYNDSNYSDSNCKD
jgi:hypothetical protein